MWRGFLPHTQHCTQKVLPRRLRTAQSLILLNSQDKKLSYRVIEAYLLSARERGHLGWAGTRPREEQPNQGLAAGVRNPHGPVIERGDKPCGGCNVLPSHLVSPSPSTSRCSCVGGSQPLGCKGGQLYIPSKPFQEPYQMS